MSNWASFDPMASLGVDFTDKSDANTSTTSHTTSATPHPMHPDNAMFWFGALAAVTFGLIGVSTHLRFGPLKASASAGKS